MFLVIVITWFKGAADNNLNDEYVCMTAHAVIDRLYTTRTITKPHQRYWTSFIHIVWMTL